MIWTCNHLFEQSHGMPTRCILALLNEAQSSRLWLFIISTFFYLQNWRVHLILIVIWCWINRSFYKLKVIFTVQVCKFDNEYMDHIKVLFKIKKTLSTYLVISSTNIFRVFTFFHFLQLNLTRSETNKNRASLNLLENVIFIVFIRWTFNIR